jgi:metal-sulfur cluster biosynthetic enzyme
VELSAGGRGRLSAERGLRAATDAHGRQPVQPDRFDQRPDVRLRMRQPERLPLRAQALREAGEVDHQRRVGEAEIREVDDHVTGSGQRSRQGPASAAARDLVLVPLDPQDRELFVERDDPGKLLRTHRFVQAPDEIPLCGSHTLVRMVHEEDVLEALSNVIDPELGLDFVELGLVYGLEIDGGRVTITFTLTTPACPIGPQVSEQMEEFVGEIPGVEEVVPNMVFSPPWTPDKMSEDAKFALGY